MPATQALPVVQLFEPCFAALLTILLSPTINPPKPLAVQPLELSRLFSATIHSTVVIQTLYFCFNVSGNGRTTNSQTNRRRQTGGQTHRHTDIQTDTGREECTVELHCKHLTEYLSHESHIYIQSIQYSVPQVKLLLRKRPHLIL
jgi:hypothetical protein